MNICFFSELRCNTLVYVTVELRVCGGKGYYLGQLFWRVDSKYIGN
jgi:hypothetical protein